MFNAKFKKASQRKEALSGSEEWIELGEGGRRRGLHSGGG